MRPQDEEVLLGMPEVQEQEIVPVVKLEWHHSPKVENAGPSPAGGTIAV